MFIFIALLVGIVFGGMVGHSFGESAGWNSAVRVQAESTKVTPSFTPVVARKVPVTKVKVEKATAKRPIKTTSKKAKKAKTTKK